MLLIRGLQQLLVLALAQPHGADIAAVVVALRQLGFPLLELGLQGGEHMVLGLVIDNPEPDHLAYEVTVTLSAEVDGEVEAFDERTVVYDEALVSYDAGRAELLNLVVILDEWPRDGRRWISVEVTDACGRSGVVDHAIDS